MKGKVFVRIPGDTVEHNNKVNNDINVIGTNNNNSAVHPESSWVLPCGGELEWKLLK